MYLYLQPGDLEKAQLGLGHSYSRAKVKFNVNRVDNMVIQAIFLLDTLDKDINSFSMRVRYLIEKDAWVFDKGLQFGRITAFTSSRMGLVVAMLVIFKLVSLEIMSFPL